MAQNPALPLTLQAGLPENWKTPKDHLTIGDVSGT
jgi:hypothetical protein